MMLMQKRILIESKVGNNLWAHFKTIFSLFYPLSSLTLHHDDEFTRWWLALQIKLRTANYDAQVGCFV